MTRADLRQLIRLTLNSADRWPDATLNAWIDAAVRLYAAHFGDTPAPDDDADIIAVPDARLEALTAYVDFAACREMQMDAAVGSDGAAITVSQLGDQARRAWNRYKDVIDQLLAMSTGGAEQVSWAGYGL